MAVAAGQPTEIVAGVQCFVRADRDGAGQGRQPIIIIRRNRLFEQIDPLRAQQR